MKTTRFLMKSNVGNYFGRFKILFLLCLFFTPFLLPAKEDYGNIIAKDIDDPDALIFLLRSPKTAIKTAIKTTMFHTDCNALMIYDAEREICISDMIDPPLFIELQNNYTFWRIKNPIVEYIGCKRNTTDKKVQDNNVYQLKWNLILSSDVLTVPIKLEKNVVFINNPAIPVNYDGYSKADEINYMLMPVLNTKKALFVFLIRNSNKDPDMPSAFLCKDTGIKLKFPSGKVFEHQLNECVGKNALKPGESCAIQIDLEQLLKESKDFSMKDFEYGLTELVWEIKLDDGKVITRNFWLVKFNGDLPEDNGNGYKLDGPLTMETFRDKKISVLPPAKPYIPEQKK